MKAKKQRATGTATRNPMSRKDYVMIAQSLGTSGASDATIADMVRHLTRDNAHFDEVRFRAAVRAAAYEASQTPPAGFTGLNPVVRSRSGRKLKPHRVGVSGYKGTRYRKNDGGEVEVKVRGRPWDDVVDDLWQMTSDGADEQAGDVSENGMWYGLLRDVLTDEGVCTFIVYTDSQGFRYADQYDDADDAQREWTLIEDDIDKANGGAESNPKRRAGRKATRRGAAPRKLKPHRVAVSAYRAVRYKINPPDKRALDFFRQHAGGVVGHALEGALHLARAEAWARQVGIVFDVNDDDERGEYQDAKGKWAVWDGPTLCIGASDPESGARESVCGVMVDHEGDPYVRVVKAEVAAGLAEQLHVDLSGGGHGGTQSHGAAKARRAR